MGHVPRDSPTRDSVRKGGGGGGGWGRRSSFFEKGGGWFGIGGEGPERGSCAVHSMQRAKKEGRQMSLTQE